MANINILDKSIYNRISAGEVVERPCSVVKELIENSVDAGSSSICVEIENGGIDLIRVLDDGCGIEFEDLKKAFMPHATSKIKDLLDLDSIETFGFRGEALPSIASVSKVEMISATNNQNNIGGRILIDGGKVESVSEYASSVGTNIIVRNLFYNTPARLKFLKSNKQEESAITNVVNRLMFANPNISFKYIVDGKIVYNVVNKGLKERIYAVYGKQTFENLIEVDKKTDKYTLSGFISKPSFCKANKTYQTLLVNNRYVSNSLVSVSILNAYENFLMKGKFPLFILNINIDFSDVDVNVHPNKMEVKFRENNKIYDLFYSTILEVLNENNCAVDFNFNNNIEKIIKKEDVNFTKDDGGKDILKEVKGGFSFSDLDNFSREISKLNVGSPIFKNNGEFDNSLSSLKSTNLINENILHTPNDKQNDINKNLFENENSSENSHFINMKNENFTIKNLESNNFSNEQIKNEVKNQNFNFDNIPQKKEQTSFINHYDFNVIGSIFNTYIIVEYQDEVFLLDQHAGHERVLFDKFVKDFEQNKVFSQPLLSPFVFNVNELEDTFLSENLSNFSSLGFLVENFGHNTYKISEVPAQLCEINLKDFVDEILSNLDKIQKKSETIKNYFATCACKAAVKGGQKLSNNEINYLLKLIFENNTTLLCPHGRPICIKISKTKIEKMFKRIV